MQIIDNVKSKYNTSILNEMDTLVCKSLFSFDALHGTLAEKHFDILQDALNLYKSKNKIRVCKLCQHSEIVIDDWYNDIICTNCYHKRNNRARIKELLNLQ
jgi:hypothetical protein